MLGTGLQLTRGRGEEDRFYNAVKACKAHRTDQLRRARSDVSDDKPVEHRADGLEHLAKPVKVVVPASESNLDRFLESITPSVPAQYPSKTTMRERRTCNVEFEPYFVLDDLWESFKEWSAYGAGVPLILNDSDCVVQYYVPYLSGIQIYADSTKMPPKPRLLGEDSDSDCRDSSSDGSSDYDHERGMKCSRDQLNHHHVTNDFPLRINKLSLRDQHVALQEDFSSDEGESMNSQGCLLFEYLERDPPYSREPLADKILDLAFRFPSLKTLRSCDLSPSSWISVAWYSSTL